MSKKRRYYHTGRPTRANRAIARKDLSISPKKAKRGFGRSLAISTIKRSGFDKNYKPTPKFTKGRNLVIYNLYETPELPKELP